MISREWNFPCIFVARAFVAPMLELRFVVVAVVAAVDYIVQHSKALETSETFVFGLCVVVVQQTEIVGLQCDLRLNK